MDANNSVVERALAAIRALNRDNEKAGLETSAEPHPTSAPARCDNRRCAGCYPVTHPESGETVYIHPPKPSQDWLDWLARWQKPKDGRVQ
jgi:hypothetical protein